MGFRGWAVTVDFDRRNRCPEKSFWSESMEVLPISIDAYRLGFIGAGKMAESIAKGIVQSGLLPPSRISTAVHSNPSRRIAFESFGVRVLPKNDNVWLSFIFPTLVLRFSVSVLLHNRNRSFSFFDCFSLGGWRKWCGHFIC